MTAFHPCIVIPVYNHEHAIGRVLQLLRGFELKCLLIDDGSSDICRLCLEDLAKTNPSWVTLKRLPENLGKGGAVTAGLILAEALGYSHAIQIDADGQHETADIPRFLEAARANPDALIAGQPKFDRSVPRARLFGRYLTHVWVWINTLSFRISDSMCGFRVYPLTSTLSLLRESRLGNRMDFDTEVLVRLYWRGVDIEQLLTPVQYPLDGVSHFEAWRDNLLISRMHTRLFFGMLWRSPSLIRRWFQP
jgi:glycosyltransferase involved in cell wall biosynthesis